MSQAEGADYRYGAHVEHVALNEHAQAGGQPHEVRYTRDGEGTAHPLSLGRRLQRPTDSVVASAGAVSPGDFRLDTASVWNRFGVSADPAIWRGFHGIDRRKHTVHMTGPGFWIWWIHQRAKT